MDTRPLPKTSCASSATPLSSPPLSPTPTPTPPTPPIREAVCGNYAPYLQEFCGITPQYVDPLTLKMSFTHPATHDLVVALTTPRWGSRNISVFGSDCSSKGVITYDPTTHTGSIRHYRHQVQPIATFSLRDRAHDFLVTNQTNGAQDIVAHPLFYAVLNPPGTFWFTPFQIHGNTGAQGIIKYDPLTQRFKTIGHYSSQTLYFGTTRTTGTDKRQTTLEREGHTLVGHIDFIISENGGTIHVDGRRPALIAEFRDEQKDGSYFVKPIDPRAAPRKIHPLDYLLGFCDFEWSLQ